MKNKFLKTLVILASGLSAIACGGNSNTKTNTEIVNEALGGARVITEVDLNRVSGQLSLSSQTMVSTTKDESDESLVTIKFSWTADDMTKWTFSDPTAENVVFATPARGEEDYAFTLTASATYEDVTLTKTISGTVLKNDGPVVTYTAIKELASKELDTIQTIEGYAFMAPKAKGKGFFVVDDTGIVYIYDKGASVVSTGNKVRITGKYTLYSSYSSNYQLDITGSDAKIEIIDTKANELPVTGAKTIDLASNRNFQRTELDAAGEMTLYHVKAYLVGYVNSQYGSPAYEYCTSADGTGAYLPWYPGNDDAFDLYGAEYGTFSIDSPLTYKNDGVCNDGQLHDFYFAVFNKALNDSDKSFKKYNIMPVCYR